jgi:hypothetical protein
MSCDHCSRSLTGSADSPTFLARARLLAGIELAQEALDTGKGNDALATGLSLLLGLAQDGLLEPHDFGRELLVVLDQAPLAQGIRRAVAVGRSQNVLEVEEGVGLLHELPRRDDSGGRVDQGAVHLTISALVEPAAACTHVEQDGGGVQGDGFRHVCYGYRSERGCVVKKNDRGLLLNL